MLQGEFGMHRAGRVWHRIAQNWCRAAQHGIRSAQQNATLSPYKRLWERDRGWHGAAYLELCYAPRNMTPWLPSH